MLSPAPSSNRGPVGHVVPTHRSGNCLIGKELTPPSAELGVGIAFESSGTAVLRLNDTRSPVLGVSLDGAEKAPLDSSFETETEMLADQNRKHLAEYKSKGRW